MALSEIAPARVAGELGPDILVAARDFADDERPIVGFAMVALYDDGSTGVSTALALPDTMMMNRYAFIGMVTEMVRESLISRQVAREIVNISNGYDPD